MDNEELVRSLESLVETSLDLVNKSEARIDNVSFIVRELVKAMVVPQQELDRVLAQCEEVQRQNTTLIERIAAKDRQIAKLEGILLSQLGSAKVEFNNKV